MAKIPLRYPFKCPNCKSIANIEMTDNEHDDDTYTEDWQCDDCGISWKNEFDLVRISINNED